MKKSTVKTLMAAGLLVLGVLTLVFRNQGRLGDAAASVIMVALMLVALVSHFLVDRVYRSRRSSEATDPADDLRGSTRR